MELFSLPTLRRQHLGDTMTKRIVFLATNVKPGKAFVVDAEYMPGFRKTFISKDFDTALHEVEIAIDNPVETYYKEESK
jgi:hypothetical protein